jgi:hypothetical protein
MVSSIIAQLEESTMDAKLTVTTIRPNPSDADLSFVRSVYPTLPDEERDEFLAAMTQGYNVTAEDITEPNPDAFAAMYHDLPERDRAKVDMLLEGFEQIELDKKRLFYDIDLLQLKGYHGLHLWILRPDDAEPEGSRIVYQDGDVRVALRLD